MKVKCINNIKCENFLDVGEIYEAKQSNVRYNCYSVLVKDKKHRVGENFYDFTKIRFEVINSQ